MNDPQPISNDPERPLNVSCALCGAHLPPVATIEDALATTMQHGLEMHPLDYPYSCAICHHYTGPLPLPTTIFEEPPTCPQDPDVTYGDQCPMFTPRDTDQPPIPPTKGDA